MKKFALTFLLGVLFLSCQNEKTGYVDTEELFEGYEELTEVRDRFNKENDNILNDLELKIKSYQIKEDLFRKNGPTMSRSKQEERYNELQAEAQQIQQERQTRLGKLQVDSQRVIDSLITKVKDKVATYGEQNGYTYIFGSNDAGSVLYGIEGNDLTQTILSELNASYKADKGE